MAKSCWKRPLENLKSCTFRRPSNATKDISQGPPMSWAFTEILCQSGWLLTRSRKNSPLEPSAPPVKALRRSAESKALRAHCPHCGDCGFAAPPSAVRLCLTDRATETNRGYASQTARRSLIRVSGACPVRRSLTALCGGKAAQFQLSAAQLPAPCSYPLPLCPFPGLRLTIIHSTFYS